MNPEEIKKILAQLTGETPISQEDATKLIQELHDATARGLTAKNQELIGTEKKLKEQIEALTTANKKAIDDKALVEEQLKKNNPEEAKKYYEGQLQTEQAKFDTAIKAAEAERDKFRDSHYARIRDDAVAVGLKNINFVDGLRDGFIALAMQKNRFEPHEIDGKVVFTNQDNKTIEAVLHELTLSAEGKAYIKNTSSGAGSPPASPGNQGAGAGAGSGNSVLERKAFDAMNNQQKMDFITKGGTVVDTPAT